MTIGAKIQASRKQQNMTCEELGVKVGLSGSSVWKLENGQLKGGPDPDTVIRIAEAIGDDSILLHYIETNPVYQHIIPKIFPDLNNIRREPATIFYRFASEAREAVDAAQILGDIFSNADPSRTPSFDDTFKLKMEQLIDVKRCAEILEFELMASGVITKDWLQKVYDRQQRKCEDHGHHTPEEAA